MEGKGGGEGGGLRLVRNRLNGNKSAVNNFDPCRNHDIMILLCLLMSRYGTIRWEIAKISNIVTKSYDIM